jgi:hypothetical protein
MRWIMPLIITAGLAAVAITLSIASHSSLPGLVMVLGTAIWAAADSARLEMDKYEDGPGGPFFVSIAIGLLWILFFPSYLEMRSRRMNGKLKLKRQYQDKGTQVEDVVDDAEQPPH